MPVDAKYIGGDNEMENGNYVLETGCVSKVARALAMEQCVIDGLTVGNGGYAALRREGNTPEARAKWIRYCQDVMRYFEDTGQVADVEIIAEQGSSKGSVRWLVKFRDLISNSTAEVATIPPWGM
jgi:hypothetical protein